VFAEFERAMICERLMIRSWSTSDSRLACIGTGDHSRLACIGTGDRCLTRPQTGNQGSASASGTLG
jgi:hypothetical protein